MKISKHYAKISFVIFLLISFGDQPMSFKHKGDNYSIKASFSYDSIIALSSKTCFKVLTIQEMETIIGGCGGGTCKDYPHTCGEGCTHHSANKCAGTVGNCVDNGWYILCRCGSVYEFKKGCN